MKSLITLGTGVLYVLLANVRQQW